MNGKPDKERGAIEGHGCDDVLVGSGDPYFLVFYRIGGIDAEQGNVVAQSLLGLTV